MIVRIVEMKFKAEGLSQFLSVFEESKAKIRSFPGVLHLELLQNQEDNCTLYTYSHWESADHLEVYRQSELFKETWKKTKIHFGAKAKAWSSNRIAHLP